MGKERVKRLFLVWAGVFAFAMVSTLLNAPSALAQKANGPARVDRPIIEKPANDKVEKNAGATAVRKGVSKDLLKEDAPTQASELSQQSWGTPAGQIKQKQKGIPKVFCNRECRAKQQQDACMKSCMGPLAGCNSSAAKVKTDNGAFGVTQVYTDVIACGNATTSCQAKCSKS